MFRQCHINFYQTHTGGSLLLAFMIPLATSVTVHVSAQKITDTTHVKPQRAKRFEVGRYTFKNKFKLVLLKITLMPQTNEAFVWSNVNTKSTLQYPFEFSSDVSFRGTIFSIYWHALFVLSWIISDLTFVFLLLSLLVSVQPDISKTFSRFISENDCSHKNVLLIIRHVWRTNRINSGHEKTVR